MTRLMTAIVAAVLLVVCGPAIAQDDEAARVAAWIEDNVPGLMRDSGMPGFSIAVVRDGETIFAEGFGARDPARGLPATPDTLYGIGSITKSFVAIAVLQLAAEGKLDIDDPVSAHLPFELGNPDDPIRIRHFMTHSPGFPNLATSSVLLGRGLGNDMGVPMTSAADFFRFVNGATDEVVFPPGEHYFYNNAAWRMLGAIVQEVSGMPFHEYVTERVIRPLGMARSTFNTEELFADADHLVPHRRGENGPEATPFPYPNPNVVGDFAFLSAAGGISSSVIEMTRYMNMLIDQGRYAGGELIPRRAMREMQSLQVRVPDGYHGTAGYGFGLSVVPDFLGETLIAHGGSIVVSTAQMSFIPEHRIGVVMMGNSGGMDYSTIAESVLAILLGRNPAEAVPAVGVRERMQRFAGSYSTYEDIQTLDIAVQGGLLYLMYDSGPTPLIPEDPLYRGNAFYTLYEGRKTPIEFRPGEDGDMAVLIGRYVYRQN